MGPEIKNKSSSAASLTDTSIAGFSRVNNVTTGWILDFMFVSLCRHFKKGNFEEFNETILTLQAISESSVKGEVHDEKTMICAFLARVMHGKQLDVLFEEDTHVMPLMSAANIWTDLEDTVADESLFKNITILLFVQSVAVCLDQGQESSASSALKWFEDNHKVPENLKVKLSTIVTERETCHPLLMSFSFNRLLETLQSYLDAYLEKNPSDYLLKAATKMVQSSHTGDDVMQVSALPGEAKKSTSKKTKRKLLNTNIVDEWEVDSCRKSYVTVRRISQSEISRLTSGKPMDTSKIQKKRKSPQKWTDQQDRYLTAGVKRHGRGKWSRILLDYDFDGRTGTMLKDRWRVLTKMLKVD
ncbi:telomeric repeat-binding factor 1 [Cottoperca gobio]|uniref:Telomeric repeat-binding factor n=1 Tax=Cottoperca gobio TaxID=56716 RepID=A0A6J2RUS2_COTGO|nr:telomeric repeat-binding factor 1 [Cottoperca gobio]